MGDIEKKLYAYKQQMLNELLALKDIQYVDLNEMQERKILRSLLNMPIDDQSLLIFKNYYNYTFEEIGDLLDIQNPKGEYLYLNSVLSEILEIDNKFISDYSMVKISELLAQKTNQEVFSEIDDKVTTENKSKKALIFKQFNNKKVVHFVVCILLGVSVLFSANAFAEGKLFKWVITTFEKYSSFNIGDENKVDKGDLKVEISYIPEGFELHKKANNPDSDIYYYKKDKEYFVIRFVYSDIDLLLNTEGSVKEETVLDGEKIIFWEKDNSNYFVLNKDHVGCLIYGNIDKDEAIKIYNGVSIKK